MRTARVSTWRLCACALTRVCWAHHILVDERVDEAECGLSHLESQVVQEREDSCGGGRGARGARHAAAEGCHAVGGGLWGWVVGRGG
jgi:hypothetical protein